MFGLVWFTRNSIKGEMETVKSKNAAVVIEMIVYIRKQSTFNNFHFSK